MREVQPKTLPSTLPAAIAEIRRLARSNHALQRTVTALEDKLVDIAVERCTILGSPTRPQNPLVTKING